MKDLNFIFQNYQLQKISDEALERSAALKGLEESCTRSGCSMCDDE